MPSTTPEAGQALTIDLPGERVRANVEKVVNAELIMAKLVTAPMAKTHSYRIGDIVPCQREIARLGDAWVAIDENRLRLAKLAAKIEKRGAA